jgi:hypothetical protein
MKLTTVYNSRKVKQELQVSLYLRPWRPLRPVSIPRLVCSPCPGLPRHGGNGMQQTTNHCCQNTKTIVCPYICLPSRVPGSPTLLNDLICKHSRYLAPYLSSLSPYVRLVVCSSHLFGSILIMVAFGSTSKQSPSQWADDHTTLTNDADSDSSSSPLVVRHPASFGTPKRFTSSPRRNGIVLDANVRSLFGLKSPSSPRRWSRGPDRIPTCRF